MTNVNNFWLSEEWANPEYQQSKQLNFEILSKDLVTPPSKLLDIGCGLAWESRLINEKYNTELWLLDGDSSANESKPSFARDINYNESAEQFLFYHPLTLLNDELVKLGTKNYHLIDCNNINISEDIKFDVITSWLSCGFHYPATTYKDLILKHSHKDTRIIVDIRTSVKHSVPILEDGVEIVKILHTRRKAIIAEIKFK
jgi:hypothetical protein